MEADADVESQNKGLQGNHAVPKVEKKDPLLFYDLDPISCVPDASLGGVTAGKSQLLP